VPNEFIEPPAWVLETVDVARRIFGVDDPVWVVDVVMNDHPGGDPNNVGHCTTRPYNRRVLIEFSTDLQPDSRGRGTIFHEVLHMAMAGLDCSTDFVTSQLKKELQTFAEDPIVREREAVVSTISRAVERFVYPKEVQ